MSGSATTHTPAENHKILLLDTNYFIEIVVSVQGIVKNIVLIGFEHVVIVGDVRVKLLTILGSFDVRIIRWPATKAHIDVRLFIFIRF